MGCSENGQAHLRSFKMENVLIGWASVRSVRGTIFHGNTCS